MTNEDLTRDLKMLPIGMVEPNEGQLAEQGLPQNPRTLKKDKFEKLKQDISAYPELLAYRSLLVYPLDNGKYIIIGGNMRYRAMCELKHTEVPVRIIPKETPIERLQAYTILDNSGFGKWNWDLLANEWDEDLLDSWGVDVPTKKGGKESKDLSEQLGLVYKVEIDCVDEAEQEKLYNILKEEGYSCRVLTL